MGHGCCTAALLHTGREFRICLFCFQNNCVGQVICLDSC